jgi:hypothetical protein
MPRVLLQGELKPFGLLAVMQLLCAASVTGSLDIDEFGLTFTLFLAKGYVVASSAPDQEPLGSKLLQRGRITDQQVQRALDLQSAAEARGRQIPLGRILVHQEMVTEKDLEECVFDQIIETICLAMELPNPHFTFATLSSMEPVRFRAFVNFQFALLEAFRIADELRASRLAGEAVSPAPPAPYAPPTLRALTKES